MAFADAVALTTGKWLDKDLCRLATNSKHSSKNLLLFIFSLQDLCASPSSPKGTTSKLLRSSAWQRLDFNNNGIVSLAETGKWIKERLINFYCGDADNKAFGLDDSEAELLYKYFYPCFIRAFLDAADYGAPTKVTQKGGGKSYSATGTAATGDDYVQFKEFRLLCTYLCIYATIWEAFATLDGGGKGVDATDDRRVDTSEWASNSEALVGHPLRSLSLTANKENSAAFSAMDADGKGKVLLAEFSTYIEDYEFELGTRWGKLLNAGEPVKASAGAATGAS